MDSELLISVIMPVYNGEKTVARAIESVLCQMDGRIELILVDDGSKDSSGAICDGYAAKQPNIHVIHKENGGTSSAKNRGIAIAKGQYLSFMDCDDTLEPTTYAEIMPILLEHAPDCLDFGYYYVDNQGTRIPSIHKNSKNQLLTLDTLNSTILPPLLNLKKDDEHFIFDFACNKIFKTSIIHGQNIHFDEDKRTWEDRTFLLRHLKHCQSYYCMDRCFYNYIFTPNSLSQRYTLDYFRIILANFRHYRELFEDRFDFNTQYVCDYWSRAIENMIFRSLEQTENQDQIQQNIITALQDEQVVHWISRRKCISNFEKKVSALIVNGSGIEALALYKKENKRQRRKQRPSFFSLCKRFIKKVLGR